MVPVFWWVCLPTTFLFATQLRQDLALLEIWQSGLDLGRGKIDRFSIDTLVEVLGNAGAQVSLKVRRRRRVAEHRRRLVERYIPWPGQALAYTLGEIQIRRHRA